MNFRTPISVPKSSNQIDYHSKVISVGSCFAVNMSEKFDYFKFRQYANPFGIIFNPVSIEKLLERTLSQRFFTASDLFYENELWNCFEIHSELSNPDKEDMLINLNGILVFLNDQLKEATHFILTIGTAWVYRYKDSGEYVANCYKVPQSQFSKELLSPEEIEQSLKNIYTFLKELNPEVNIILTVSPVRHIKDGFTENQRSKAHIITALHRFIETLPEFENKSISYFPAYEFMIDDLRDYRFYAEDMLHPNKTAIDYIWGKFTESHISGRVKPIMEELDSIQKGLAHKPFNPNTEQHGHFLKKLNERILVLQEKHPFLKLS